jgi:hypothetical protein
MTKVKVAKWNKPMELEEALEPYDPYPGHGAGAVENAQSKADVTAKAVGRLLAHLVGTGVLTLNDAAHIAGEYSPLEFVA